MALLSGSSALPLKAMLLLSCVILKRISSLKAHLCPMRPQNSALPGRELRGKNARGQPCPLHPAGEPYLTDRGWGSDACARRGPGSAFLGVVRAGRMQGSDLLSQTNRHASGRAPTGPTQEPPHLG